MENIRLQQRRTPDCRQLIAILESVRIAFLGPRSARALQTAGGAAGVGIIAERVQVGPGWLRLYRYHWYAYQDPPSDDDPQHRALAQDRHHSSPLGME